MNIYIIIVNYNHAKDTIRCIDRLEHQKLAHGLKLKILVVDNNSNLSDKTFLKINICQKTDALLILNDINLGFSGGVNSGLKLINYNEECVIILLNYDTDFDANFIQNMIDYLYSADEIGIASPVLRNNYKDIELFNYGTKLNWYRRPIVREYFEKITEFENPDTVHGTAMFIKSKVISKVGMFDINYFLYFEDDDFCLRASKYFKIAINPNTFIIHKGSTTVGWLSKTMYYNITRSGYIFSNSYCNSLQSIIFKLTLNIQSIKFMIKHKLPLNYLNIILIAISDVIFNRPVRKFI